MIGNSLFRMPRKSFWGRRLFPPGYRDCIVLFFLAWVLRLIIHGMDSMISRDGVIYLNMIQCWHDSGSYEGMLESLDVPYSYSFDYEDIPSLFFFLAQLVMDLGYTSFTATFLLNLFFGCSLPLLGYGMARFVFRQRWKAFASGLLFVVHPFFVSVSIQPQRDVGYLFFSGLTVLFAMYALFKHYPSFWTICGICIALACMIRIEALEFLAIFPLLFLFQFIQKKETLHFAARNILYILIPFFATFVLMNFWMGRSLKSISKIYISHYTSEKNKMFLQ